MPLFSIMRASGWIRVWLLLLPVWLIYAAFVTPPPWDQGYTRSSTYLIYSESERSTVQSRAADDARRVCVTGTQSFRTDELVRRPGPEPRFIDYLEARKAYSQAYQKWREENRRVKLGLEEVFPAPGSRYILEQQNRFPSEGVTFFCQSKAEARRAWLYTIITVAGTPIAVLGFVLLLLRFLPELSSIGSRAARWIIDGFRKDDQPSHPSPGEHRLEPSLDRMGPDEPAVLATKQLTRFSKPIQWVLAFLGAWPLSLFTVDGQENVILAAIQAAPAAVLSALLVVAFMRADDKSPFKEWCLSALILGLLAFGRAFGGLRNLGWPWEEATASALVNESGLLIIAGAVGLALLSRMRSPRS